MDAPFAIALAWVQAVYFLITGAWPIVHMPSFLAVTGPKRDLWLVKTVGALVCAVALTIGLGAWQGSVHPQTILLAVASAGALLKVDVVYVLKRVIGPVYLIDAIAEALIIGAWGYAWFAR